MIIFEPLLDSSANSFGKMLKKDHPRLLSIPAAASNAVRGNDTTEVIRKKNYSCDSSDHLLLESPGPKGPKSQKSLKKSLSRGLQKKSPKIPEKVEKYPKKSNFGDFSTFSGIFGDFFCRPLERLFLRLFWDFGAGGPETPSVES